MTVAEFVEWRAVGVDQPRSSDEAPTNDCGVWHQSKSKAERDLANLEASHPAFDECWVEWRTVSVPQRASS